jgi:hypothetical protein
VERIIVTIHGPGFQDFEVMEVVGCPRKASSSPPSTTAAS